MVRGSGREAGNAPRTNAVLSDGAAGDGVEGVPTLGEVVGGATGVDESSSGGDGSAGGVGRIWRASPRNASDS